MHHDDVGGREGEPARKLVVGDDAGGAETGVAVVGEGIGDGGAAVGGGEGADECYGRCAGVD
jgi:hypothetical protein